AHRLAGLDLTDLLQCASKRGTLMEALRNCRAPWRAYVPLPDIRDEVAVLILETPPGKTAGDPIEAAARLELHRIPGLRVIAGHVVQAASNFRMPLRPLRVQELHSPGRQILHDHDGLVTLRVTVGVVALRAVNRYERLDIAIEASLVGVHF